jgi:TPR repeat protein
MPKLARMLALAVALAALSRGAVAQDVPPAPLCDALAADPFDPDRLGEGVMFDRIDGERAVSACEEAATADPGNLRLAYQLGRAYARAERADEALPLLRRAATAGGLAAMYALGDLLAYHQSEGKTGGTAREGVDWMRRAADAGYAPALVGLGAIYADGRILPRDDAAADDYYRRAADTGNPYGQLYAALRLDDRAGDDATQLAAAERLLRASAAQGWRDAYNGLAWFLYVHNRGDLVEAERFARRAVAAYPDDVPSADTLGAILLRRGQAAEALVYLEFAAASEDDNADYHERYGDALWALGRRDDAREAWNDALPNAQSDAQQQRLRERLARQ